MKALATYQKLRGGYYTPEAIAHFLASWAIQKPDVCVLEPSCGDGNLLKAAVQRLIEHGTALTRLRDLVQGVELDPQEAAKAAESLSELTGLAWNEQIEVDDFFAFSNACLSKNKLFDVIIANPPFIRYQNFPEQQRNLAFFLMQKAGLHPNRLTNSWVPFLAVSSLLLNEGGRIAMIIPAELLQVNYAAELRLFLSKFYAHITIITFKKLVFEGIQQEVVLLLGEKSQHSRTGIKIVEFEGVSELAQYQPDILGRTEAKDLDHSTEKWTRYFLDQNELDLLREVKDNPNLFAAGDTIDVDVGIVTGLNDFFVLTEQQVKDKALVGYTHRLVGRSAQLPGIIFSETDWTSNVEKQSPAFLLNSPDLPFYALPTELKTYILDGEERGLNKGYKCRIRNRWYVLPSIWTPQAFMLRQIHGYPKIIINEAAATCTDTIHRVKLRNGVSARLVAAAFLNSLTFAFSEVMGRSYGGGVLELEPNEAERLPLPLKKAELLDLVQIDHLMREGNIQAVLDITDEILLKKGLGLTQTQIVGLRSVWQKLRDRRIYRKSEPANRKS